MSKVAADRVAQHLVAAGRLVDEDPQAALEQARAARALGSRVAVVREAVGETAYAAGEWAEAIAELRTARRMTGDDSGLPMLADAERALGRADRALRLAQSPEAAVLEPEARAEMVIVEAGARHDLGQLDAALVTLQDFGLDRTPVQPWSARVWYAYADLLLAAGREDEAREWFAAAAGADREGTTDAEERLLELDGVVVVDEDDADGDDPAGTGPIGEDPDGGRAEDVRSGGDLFHSDLADEGSAGSDLAGSDLADDGSAGGDLADAGSVDGDLVDGGSADADLAARGPDGDLGGGDLGDDDLVGGGLADVEPAAGGPDRGLAADDPGDDDYAVGGRAGAAHGDEPGDGAVGGGAGSAAVGGPGDHGLAGGGSGAVPGDRDDMAGADADLTGGKLAGAESSAGPAAVVGGTDLVDPDVSAGAAASAGAASARDGSPGGPASTGSVDARPGRDDAPDQAEADDPGPDRAEALSTDASSAEADGTGADGTRAVSAGTDSAGARGTGAGGAGAGSAGAGGAEVGSAGADDARAGKGTADARQADGEGGVAEARFAAPATGDAPTPEASGGSTAMMFSDEPGD